MLHILLICVKSLTAIVILGDSSKKKFNSVRTNFSIILLYLDINTIRVFVRYVHILTFIIISAIHFCIPAVLYNIFSKFLHKFIRTILDFKYAIRRFFSTYIKL